MISFDIMNTLRMKVIIPLSSQFSVLSYLKDAPHGGQLLAAEAAHDAGLAEQGLDGRVAAGDGTRMA